jgi:hypothetical protein
VEETRNNSKTNILLSIQIIKKNFQFVSENLIKIRMRTVLHLRISAVLSEALTLVTLNVKILLVLFTSHLKVIRLMTLV